MKKTWTTIVTLVVFAACSGAAPTRDDAEGDYVGWDAADDVSPQLPGNDDEEDIWLDFAGTGEMEEGLAGDLAAASLVTVCVDSQDCDGLPCIDAGTGFQCADICIEECPAGYECRSVGFTDQGGTNVCVPDFVPYCRPCHDSTDCARFVNDDASFCYESGSDLGSYCTTACSGATDCPKGFVCDEEGICVAEKDVCQCNLAATNIGHSTPCIGEGGTACFGERTCTADGLGSCDAPEPEEEVCNGADDDCDGKADEDLLPGTCEVTNDHGTCEGTTSCVGGLETCSAMEPGPEYCDGVDNDCDGQVDEVGAVDCKAWFLDADGDGYGSAEAVCSCKPPANSADNSKDCDDTNPYAYLSAPEFCDNQDNDCDGEVDEDCDHDGDGYCAVQPSAVGPDMACKYTQVDCNDLSADIHPGHAEWCDGQDNNCNQLVDELCDADGDGYCEAPVLQWGEEHVCHSPHPDCNDDDPSIHPDAVELCDGINQNCNDVVDDHCDDDADGYCEAAPPASVSHCYPMLKGNKDEACAAVYASCPNGFGDCDDYSLLIHPGADEVCNMLDDNCDGEADEPFDQDGDGFCAADALVQSNCIVCVPGAPADCNDSFSAINPGADDLPDLMGIDQNCDGIDGTVARALFVSPTGSDGNVGSAAAPLKSLQGAIDQAYSDPDRYMVLVATGTYVGSIELRKGVHVWGGYLSAQDWAVSYGMETKVIGGPLAMEAKKIEGYTTVGRMTVQATDGGSSGADSIGLLASHSPALSLVDMVIMAGNGAAGANGSHGTNGMSGKSGEAGLTGCFTGSSPFCNNSETDNTCPGFALGAKGMEFTCGGRGDGMGDIPMTGSWSPSAAATWSGVLEGEPSCCYKKWGAVKGGQHGLYAGNGKDGSAGGDGVDGDYGTHGKGGNGKGTMAVNGFWGMSGKDGKDGTDGCGGGGGGMGKTKVDSTFWCDAKGGGGGGGGAGGTAGTGGSGGQAGGSSIAVALYTSPIEISACTLVAGNGGKGGNGGNGGAGGPGGSGGLGGDGYKGSGRGGNGGKGGKGGFGGVGGGGSGGMSAGLVYNSSGTQPIVQATSFVLGSPGQGGLGGLTSGKYPVNGSNGLPGKKANMVSAP